MVQAGLAVVGAVASGIEWDRVGRKSCGGGGLASFRH